MHFPLLLVFLVVTVFPDCALGQADTALHRRVYDAVNASTGSMKQVKTKTRVPGLEYDHELTIFSDKSGVRKIVSVAHDDDGDVEREYYYENGALLFVYQATKGFEGEKQVVRVEDRHYFKDGAMFKWLAGKEKAVITAKDPQFAATADELLKASAAFLKAASGGAAPQLAVGTFTGIEQGDYAHLNIKYPNGTEDSFFVLSDEGGLKAFLDKPDAYKGKTVEVKWEERDQDVPEAGGVQRLRVAVAARVLK